MEPEVLQATGDLWFIWSDLFHIPTRTFTQALRAHIMHVRTEQMGCTGHVLTERAVGDVHMLPSTAGAMCFYTFIYTVT